MNSLLHECQISSNWCQSNYYMSTAKSVPFHLQYTMVWEYVWWAFSATFNNISDASRRSVLAVEEAGYNHRPAASQFYLTRLYGGHLPIRGKCTHNSSSVRVSEWLLVNDRWIINVSNLRPTILESTMLTIILLIRLIFLDIVVEMNQNLTIARQRPWRPHSDITISNL